jgi:hypothetical protein
MRSKFDHPTFGFVLGMIFPMMGLYVFYLTNFKSLGFLEFIDQMMGISRMTHVISLSVISNLAVFYFFIWKKFYFSVRGVLFATLVYTLIVVVQKFMT